MKAQIYLSICFSILLECFLIILLGQFFVHFPDSYPKKRIIRLSLQKAQKVQKAKAIIPPQKIVSSLRKVTLKNIPKTKSAPKKIAPKIVSKRTQKKTRKKIVTVAKKRKIIKEKKITNKKKSVKKAKTTSKSSLVQKLALAAPKTAIASPTLPIAVLPSISNTSIDEQNKYLKLVYKTIQKKKRYPKRARKRNIEGKFIFYFQINSKGKIINIKSETKRPKSLFKASHRLLANSQLPPPPVCWNTQKKIKIPLVYKLH